MYKEIKETMIMMSHQIDNMNKEMEIIKRNQMEILRLKIATKLKIH